MIVDRELAANLRYQHFDLGRPLRDLSGEFNLSLGQVQRVMSGGLCQPTEERVVVNPDFSPRNVKLTPDDRASIAARLCYGASLRSLAAEYGVAVSSIQHVKEYYTQRTTATTANTRGHAKKHAAPGEMTMDLAAEMRYLHNVRGLTLGELAARYMVPYPVAHRAARGETFRPTPPRRLAPASDGLDPESEVGMAVYLLAFGASTQFVADTCHVSQATAEVYQRTYTQVG